MSRAPERTPKRNQGTVMSKIKGTQAIIKCLQEEGVEVIFGYPGGAVIELYDELCKSDIRHILVRHEQGAVHAADGYARASGKVGVALLTSGPGATNGVTAIATAYCDSIPVVVLTGQVPRALIGNDAFQEADIVGITRPCTKHNYLVKNVADLAATIKQAFYIARTGRPGPVLIDLPKDVVNSKTEFSYPETISIRSYNPNVSPNRKQLRKAAELIAHSRQPVIYAGGGVVSSDSAAELRALAEKFHLPVTTTLMGLGAFPGDHPGWLGMLGMHGTYTANMAVNNCDLLISVGARFDDRVTGRINSFAPRPRSSTSTSTWSSISTPSRGHPHRGRLQARPGGDEQLAGQLGRVPGRGGQGPAPALGGPGARVGREAPALLHGAPAR